MRRKRQFYGTATVGERGQIVLPAKMRKGFDITKGDKLLVFGHDEDRSIVLLKPEVMEEFLEAMTKDLKHIRSQIARRGD